MKSFDSSHEHAQQQDAEIEADEERKRLERRTSARPASPGPEAGAPVAAAPVGPWSFGNAVNAGIHTPSVQFKGGDFDLDAAAAHRTAAHGLTGEGQQLPFLDTIQQSFGKHDVSGIRAHVGGAATEASEALGAHAYASGDAVAFASAPDLRLAVHEAAHTVQQRGGVRLADGIGRTGDEFEQHADAVADAVVRGESAESLLDRYAHRGAAGGSAAIQRQDTAEAAARRRGGGGGRRGGGGGGAGPAADPAARIPREPNPAPLLARFRDLIQRTANSYGIGFPSTAFNQLNNQLMTMITGGGFGMLNEQTQHVEANVMSYRFRLWGRVEHGPPQAARAQRGHGTLTSGTTGGSEYGESTSQTSEETDQTSMSGTASSSAGSGGGRGGSGTLGHQHTERDQAQSGTSARSTAGRSAGSSMEGDVEHIAYESDIAVFLEGVCEPEHGNIANSIAGAFGAPAADPTRFQVDDVVGAISLEHQSAAGPEPRRRRGGGGR